jgi:hypothetical protein
MYAARSEMMNCCLIWDINRVVRHGGVVIQVPSAIVIGCESVDRMQRQKVDVFVRSSGDR